MSVNYNLAQDLKEALSMAEGLENYVRGTELYGNAGGGFFANMPSLTIGALVMRLRRLALLADQLSDAQSKQLDKANDYFAHTQREWNVHFGEKALKEANSRLDAMRTFFQECAQSNKSCAGNYPPEILRRTIVQELVQVIADNRLENDELSDKLKGTDGKLRGIVKPSPFIWAAPLQAVYPPATYWWLYQRPPQV
jgi:uncharacterized membrane-anchored protein YhcB (DUF1043 family)